MSIFSKTAIYLLLFCFPAVAIAQKVRVGKAFYLTELPAENNDQSWRRVTSKPDLSTRAIQAGLAPPISDWCSSLVWPLHSPHSQAMFPHPLAVQAFADGLGVGYTPKSHVTDSLKEGKIFQKGTDYRFPFVESVRVGLEGLEVERTVVDDYSDWQVTALWQKDKDALRATFGHGSPFVYFEKESELPFDLRFSARKPNPNEEPVSPLVFQIDQLNGAHTKQISSFRLSVNAGKNVGVGSKVRLVYDFDGDGETDRIETFGLMATAPLANEFESYDSEQKGLDQRLTQGEFQNFVNGSVRLEYWKCFGEGDLGVDLANSVVTLPLESGVFYLGHEGRFLSSALQEGAANIIQTNSDVRTGAGKVYFCEGNVLGVTVNDTHYGVFGPSGSSWKLDSFLKPGDLLDQQKLNFGDANYLSIATLPNRSAESIRFYRQFAYAFVKNTIVEYQYLPEKGIVETTFRVEVEPKEGESNQTLFALYPHQHKNLAEGVPTDFEYESPRGKMKVVSGASFTTSIPFLGVLPALPLMKERRADYGKLLAEFYHQVTNRKNPFEKRDTYWNGKELGKVSEVIQIVDQLGEIEVRDGLLTILKDQLEKWSKGEESAFLYYDPIWKTMVGYPDSYGSADQFNDHHFHYSYFIKAAATIGQFDPEWVRRDNFGGIIDLLIRDCANYDRMDFRFPWMRNFDPYAGHSWASGHAGFAAGNNQESSSESMNFATSLILYGIATDNEEIRDLGIYWHSTEAEAIANYWFDLDGTNFPDDFGHECVGMVWGNGGTYGTWWTANPEEIHGINFLPLNGGSLYLGVDPDYIRRNFSDMLTSNANFHQAGFPGDSDRLDRWHDVIFQWYAFSDPDKARREFDSYRDLDPEFGETRLHTESWLDSLSGLGHFQPEISADYPTAVAFQKEENVYYVISNLTGADLDVTFSDGKRITAEPGLHIWPSMVVQNSD